MLLTSLAMAQDPQPAGDSTAAAAATAPNVVAPVAAPVADPAVVPSDDAVADADKVIEDGIKKIDEDPTKAANELAQLAQEGRWGPFAGLLFLFLVWICRKWVWKLIPSNVLPWLTLGLSLLVTGAVELINGVIWWKILIDVFIAAATASYLWSLLFKHIMKPKKA